MENSFAETLNKLKNWINFINNSYLFIALLEVVLVIVIGILSGYLDHDTNAAFFRMALIFCSIIYIAIVLLRIIYSKKFPSSVADELEAKYRLEKLEGSLERVLKINKTINDTVLTIQNFDPHSIRNYGALEATDNEYSALTQEFLKVLAPFSKELDIIFSKSTKSNFSVGIFFKSKKKENNISIPHIIFSRDDLSLEKKITKNFQLQQNLKGWLFELNSFFQSTLNNGKLETHKFKNELENKMIICSPIIIEKGPYGPPTVGWLAGVGNFER
jgi:hypothetical protein